MTTTTAKKSTNKYSPEQTAKIAEQWETFKAANPTWYEGDRVEANALFTELAAAFGTTVKSIISKLSRMNAGYVPKVYTPKTGTAGRKDEVAEAIGKLLNMADSDVDSLSKSNRSALLQILAALPKPELLSAQELANKEDYLRLILANVTGDAHEAAFRTLPLGTLQALSEEIA